VRKGITREKTGSQIKRKEKKRDRPRKVENHWFSSIKLKIPNFWNQGRKEQEGAGGSITSEKKGRG